MYFRLVEFLYSHLSNIVYPGKVSESDHLVFPFVLSQITVMFQFTKSDSVTSFLFDAVCGLGVLCNKF